MKISIVTISFNQVKYLEEAMTSVLSQDEVDLEYIVVDPGSTDGSRELIERYRARLDRTIFEPDRGAADGLNRGFAAATGEIFGFLNSDDVLLPGALHKVCRFFETHPACDVVMGSGFMVDAQGQRIRRIRSAGFTVDRYFYGAASWLQQSTFFRREAFDGAGGFNVDNRSCWDGELVLEMVLRGAQVFYLHDDLSLFRVHPQSITGSNRHKQMMEADTSRMFQRATGRKWTAMDSVRALLLRTERIFTHPGALESAVRARIYRMS
jgi:glycosyltransferase involved in cell wall biosynthesis